MKNFIFVFFLCSFLDINAQIKEVTVKSEVNEVTVFINGAQVIRRKAIELSAGDSQIKFVGLSPFLDAKSIQAKVNGEVMVLSVTHQFNYIDSAALSKDLKDLSYKNDVLSDQLNIERVNIEIIEEELTFLKDNRIIGGKNQEVSLINLKETSNFYRERISNLKMKEIEINKTIEKLNDEKSKIIQQINQISSTKPTPASEILVKINSKNQTKCDVELSYIVNNAGWYPTYDIRAKNIDEPIELIYKANIHQNTKEEWKNIKLHLSSANPKLGSIAPQLQPYYLNYNLLPPQYTSLNHQVSGKITDVATNEPLPGVNISIKGTTIGTVSDREGKYSISIPNNTSKLEVRYIGYLSEIIAINNPVVNVQLTPEVHKLDEVVVIGYGTQKKSDLTKAIKNRTPGLEVQQTRSLPIPIEQAENQTSFEFEIKTPYTLNSGNKSLAVDIEAYSLEASYAYYCAPKIDNDAFLMAYLVNWDKYNLLEGEANIFFENTFIGTSILDVRYISDTLKLSLGRDKNVIVKREKIKDYTTKQFFGGKKEETRAWQLSVKNNKKQPINLNLYDQVPVSTNEEIEVQLVNISEGTLIKEKGEIKWNLKLNPSEKKDLELIYKVKYPKGKMLPIE